MDPLFESRQNKLLQSPFLVMFHPVKQMVDGRLTDVERDETFIVLWHALHIREIYYELLKRRHKDMI